MGVGGWVVGGLVARWALGGTWKGRCAGGEGVGTTGCMVGEKQQMGRQEMVMVGLVVVALVLHGSRVVIVAQEHFSWYLHI